MWSTTEAEVETFECFNGSASINGVCPGLFRAKAGDHQLACNVRLKISPSKQGDDLNSVVKELYMPEGSTFGHWYFLAREKLSHTVRIVF